MCEGENKMNDGWIKLISIGFSHFFCACFLYRDTATMVKFEFLNGGETLLILFILAMKTQNVCWKKKIFIKSN